MINYFNNIRKLLISSCDDLKQSIDVAKDGLLTKYGKEHYAVKRLDEYYLILNKQYEYIDEMEPFIKDQNYEEAALLSNKIKAMADMIKNDAYDLIQEFNNGVSSIPDKNTWN